MLTESDASGSKTVVTGHISISGSIFTSLFDSGATHSFVSTRIVDRLCRPSSDLVKEFQILLLNGELIISTRDIRALPIVIEGRELHIDLVELVIEDFDFILGIDMLSKSIDCKHRKVTFATEGEAPFILVVSGRDLMQQGCIGFLANMVDTMRS